jgi:signal transduction histidine kinase
VELQLKALQLTRKQNDRLREAYTLSFIGFTYLQSGYYEKSLEYLLPARSTLEQSAEWIQASFTMSNIAFCYTSLGRMDSTHWYNAASQRLWTLGDNADRRKWALRTLIFTRLGNASEKEGKYAEAASYYHQVLANSLRDSIQINITTGYKSLASVCMQRHMDDSAIYYARNALQGSEMDRQKIASIDAAKILAAVYKRQGNEDSAMRYLSMAMELNETVYGPDEFRALQMLISDEQEYQKKLEMEKAGLQARQRMLLMVVIAAALLAVALIQRRNNRAKQKINQQLLEQKATLEKTLAELKSAQAQLVQAEKMASLGELTAGIAHEIQNPLNFVNNFSEVNTELSDDILAATQRGDMAEIRALAADIKSNQEKIYEHGKRADAIVKSMLQHSRSSSGSNQPTDINALCDEYMRLAYHGYRAKDKSFNATLQTAFDPAAGAVSVISQEIGRVLLNLLNNAFYAVDRKSKSQATGYSGEVKLSTRRIVNKVEVSVIDNGDGIPGTIRGKIFQPFFTTKPTGQGTGLGLSLSYDIVKAHGGDIRVESQEGQGTTFTVSLNA